MMRIPGIPNDFIPGSPIIVPKMLDTAAIFITAFFFLHGQSRNIAISFGLANSRFIFRLISPVSRYPFDRRIKNISIS